MGERQGARETHLRGERCHESFPEVDVVCRKSLLLTADGGRNDYRQLKAEIVRE